MTPAPDTGRTAEENEMREALLRAIDPAAFSDAMDHHDREERREVAKAAVDRLLSGPLAPILQEAAHLLTENANLRDRVREAEGAGRGPSDTGSHPTGEAAQASSSLRDVDPSRVRQRRDEDEFACEYDPGLTPEGDTYTLLWENGSRWLVADRVGRITVGQSPANGSTAQQTTWQALAALGIEAAVPPKPKGSAEGESPARRAMPDPLSPEPQEAGDHEPR